MFAQYFGHYLLNSGLVAANELERAMETQKQTRVKLGVLAINRGLMNGEQVEEVHQAQTRADKRFGEIAAEMGYLTEAQVDELLSTQQSSNLTLGQSLIDLGILSFDRFASALNQYKEAYSLSDEQFERITHGDIEALLEALLLKDGMAQNQAWVDYVKLFAKNTVRFLDGDIRMEKRSDTAGNYDWVVFQPLTNGGRGLSRRTALAGSKAAFLEIASLFAQEKVNDLDMMQAAVGEYLNLHNGIYLVNQSNRGVELDLKPQSFVKGSEPGLFQSDKAVIRIVASGFEFDLIVENLSDLV